MQHFDLYKLTNANILCLVRFGSGQNKLVQLLIRPEQLQPDRTATYCQSHGYSSSCKVSQLFSQYQIILMM